MKDKVKVEFMICKECLVMFVLGSSAKKECPICGSSEIEVDPERESSRKFAWEKLIEEIEG